MCVYVIANSKYFCTVFKNIDYYIYPKRPPSLMSTDFCGRVFFVFKL